MTGDTFIPAAFVCRACGRSMLVLTSPEPPPDRTCNLCAFMPGWFRVPEIRALVDHARSNDPLRNRELNS